MCDALQERLQDRNIEDRLRDGVLRAGFHLEFEAANFFLEVRCARVGAHADHKSSSSSDGVAADIESLVKIVRDVHQSDRVHIEDGGGVRIIPQLRRISGHAKNVLDANGGGSQQV